MADDLSNKQKSACSIKNAPVPGFIVCSQCGEEVEIWTDEEEGTCHECGRMVSRKEVRT